MTVRKATAASDGRRSHEDAAGRVLFGRRFLVRPFKGRDHVVRIDADVGPRLA